jgi:NRPS condensation-like uncharacterized protein
MRGTDSYECAIKKEGEPEMNSFESRIANLSPVKLELLSRGIKAVSHHRSPLHVIEKRKRHDLPAPLSFAQQRLWFLTQLDPHSAAFHIPVAVRLVGGLDTPLLEVSLNEVVKRHESLRTAFTEQKGEPVQIIAPVLRLNLPIVDLCLLDKAQREAEAKRLAVESARLAFDLERPPLMRAMLLRMGEQDHILLLTMHHIIADAWSIRVLIRETAEVYQAFSQGRRAKLPELPIQYADFASWQRNWLSGKEIERQLDYWKRQLDQAPFFLEIPPDRPRPEGQTGHGAHFPFTIGSEITASLNALSKQTATTLFMTILAAFQVLLHYYTGSDDIVIGTDIANRTHMATEGLIGFLVNQLVLRTGLAGNPTFTEILRHVRGVTMDAYAHQDLPFEKLVEALGPERSMTRAPLFQIKLAFQNVPAAKLELPGLALTPIEIDSGTAQLDLILNMTQAGHELNGGLEYNTDLYDQDTMARFLSNFETLLRLVGERPKATLEELNQLIAKGDEEYKNNIKLRLKESRLSRIKEVRRRSQGAASKARTSDRRDET